MTVAAEVGVARLSPPWEAGGGREDPPGEPRGFYVQDEDGTFMVC